jgi:hypothetical protein
MPATRTALFTVSAGHSGNVLHVGVDFAFVERLLDSARMKADLVRTLDVRDIVVVDRTYRVVRIA